MPNKYCPILLIGFPAPKKGERDLRRCTKECALHNANEDTCAINSCLEALTMLQQSMEALPEYVFDMMSYNEDDYLDIPEQD